MLMLFQDTHDKLRRLADIIAALLSHRLEATKKGPATAARDNNKVKKVTLLGWLVCPCVECVWSARPTTVGRENLSILLAAVYSLAFVLIISSVYLTGKVQPPVALRWALRLITTVVAGYGGCTECEVFFISVLCT